MQREENSTNREGGETNLRRWFLRSSCLGAYRASFLDPRRPQPRTVVEERPISSRLKFEAEVLDPSSSEACDD